MKNKFNNYEINITQRHKCITTNDLPTNKQLNILKVINDNLNDRANFRLIFHLWAKFVHHIIESTSLSLALVNITMHL